MWNRSLRIKLACTLLMISGMAWLSGCAQNSRNINTPSECLDVPCIPCIFPIPLKFNQPDCKIAKDNKKL